MSDTTRSASRPDGPTISAQLNRSILIATALAEAIQALGSVPSGIFYARVQQLLDIHEYEKTINFLVDKKLVRRDASHLLTWIGPKAIAQTEVQS